MAAKSKGKTEPPARPAKKVVSPEAAAIVSTLGSELVKQLAGQQRVTLKLTDDQLTALAEQLKRMDASRPMEVTLRLGTRNVANLKIAGYWYSGDTCCV